MKNYIKMNGNNYYLSFGNLCKIIKEISLNKIFSSQSEIFSIIFNDDCLSDSTINNYCIGYRSIGNNYKKTFEALKLQTFFINYINAFFFLLNTNSTKR